MMELDACKALWHDPPASPPVKAIGQGELMTILHARTMDVRARALERISREGYTYVAIVITIAAMNLTRYGATLKAFVASFVVWALLGVVVAALLYKQHQLRTLPLNGSLKESLAALIHTLDSASRLYMAAYMACIVIGVALVLGFLFWRHGLNLPTLISLAAAAIFVAWCHRSGRSYLQRMFGHYRAELAECLRELETA